MNCGSRAEVAEVDSETRRNACGTYFRNVRSELPQAAENRAEVVRHSLPPDPPACARLGARTRVANVVPKYERTMRK